MSELVGLIIFNLFFPPVISILASKAIVERAQKMNQHSDKIVELSLSKWPKQMEYILPIGSTYDDDVGKYLSKTKENFEFLPHGEFTIAHMKTGYSKLWKKWGELKKVAINYSEAECLLRNTIREITHKIANEENISIYYYRTGREKPDQWIMPEPIIKAVHDELNYRKEGYEGEWVIGAPRHTLTMLGKIQTYHITLARASLLLNSDKNRF